jgi:Protein of unknown function (DUF2905)
LRAVTGAAIYECAAMKWLIATVLALALFSGLAPILRKFGIGRLPGDFHFMFRGHPVSIPIGSTLVLSALMALLSRWL